MARTITRQRRRLRLSQEAITRLETMNDSGDTWDQIAQRAGVTTNAVYQWRVRRRCPDYAYAETLARVLSLPVSSLYETDSVAA